MRRFVTYCQGNGTIQNCCPNDSCHKKLRTENSARSFNNPAQSVEIVHNIGLLPPELSVLEIGAGNLRNYRFIRERAKLSSYSVLEQESTRDRFPVEYSEFRRDGGSLALKPESSRKYNTLICTFVLETICPATRRAALLKDAVTNLQDGGILIASIRGYSGVFGTRYKRCPVGEGYISPLLTFIKPFSIAEAIKLILGSGLSATKLLQKYRVACPDNIHILAFKEL